jgi:hypothetical protein
MLKYNLLLLFFLGFLLSFSQIKLSDKAEVSIITVEPGKDLNDTWGHSAIRIHDKKLGFDAVYNYGTYDFNTPNFYTKFMRGKLLFDLGTNQFHYFLRYYSSVNRGVTEQVLNLTQQEKQAYFEYLQNNAKPENRKYLYDFFFDNCATKLRFVNTEILQDKVLYKDELFSNNLTFRDLIYQKLEKHPWGKFGIDLALGAVIDREAIPKEYTFLPSYIFENFKAAQVYRKEGLVPLVKQTNVLYKQKMSQESKTIFTPLYIFSLLALIVLLITYNDYNQKKQTKWLDFILLFSTGLIGLLVVLLWFATDHSTTKNNFNVLWAFLPNLFFAFYVFKASKQHLLKRYYLNLLILLVLMIFIWVFKIQVFNMAMIPIILMLGVRYYFNRFFKK